MGYPFLSPIPAGWGRPPNCPPNFTTVVAPPLRKVDKNVRVNAQKRQRNLHSARTAVYFHVMTPSTTRPHTDTDTASALDVSGPQFFVLFTQSRHHLSRSEMWVFAATVQGLGPGTSDRSELTPQALDCTDTHRHFSYHRDRTWCGCRNPQPKSIM